MVSKAPHPKGSRIWDYFRTGDFIDGYSVRSDFTPRQASEVAFDMPHWAAWLLALRNRIVKPLGLKTEAPGEGPAIGMFPVDYEDERELLLGMNDTHLNFRISLFKQDDRLHMATWVHRNNMMGRLYLAFVMPFHVAIVRNAMRRVEAAGKGSAA